MIFPFFKFIFLIQNFKNTTYNKRERQKDRMTETERQRDKEREGTKPNQNTNPGNTAKKSQNLVFRPVCNF